VRYVSDGLPAADADRYFRFRNVVGADREPTARQLFFVGSIKWLERSAFDNHDLVALQRHRAAITDQPIPLLAISRSGVDAPGLDVSYGPAELLGAWKHRRGAEA